MNTTTVADIAEMLREQNAGLEAFKANINQRLNEMEAAGNRPDLRSGDGSTAPDAEFKKAFLDYARRGSVTDRLEQKAMSVGTDTSGGYAVPYEIDSAITKNLRAMSPMRQLARVVPVSTGEFKLIHSTGGTTYSWVGETSARPETDTPELAQITIQAGEVYAAPKMTQRIIDDNTFNLEGWLIEELSEAFGDAEGDAFINGDGINKPRGLATYDVVSTADATRDYGKFQYVASGGAGAFAASDPSDALIALVHAVKARYRSNASWLMNPECVEAIRKFKDANDRYIWQESTQEGQPSRLFGYPVFEDENMPAIAANSLSIAFGDFKRSYLIIDRNAALLRDPYTAKPYVTFYSTRRVGGGAGRDFRAVKFLKMAAS